MRNRTYYLFYYIVTIVKLMPSNAFALVFKARITRVLFVSYLVIFSVELLTFNHQPSATNFESLNLDSLPLFINCELSANEPYSSSTPALNYPRETES